MSLSPVQQMGKEEQRLNGLVHRTASADRLECFYNVRLCIAPLTFEGTPLTICDTRREHRGLHDIAHTLRELELHQGVSCQYLSHCRAKRETDYEFNYREKG